MDSPEWLKNKKATINPQKNNDNDCFQYALTVALNCQSVGKKILEEYEKLSLLLINMIGKE